MRANRITTNLRVAEIAAAKAFYRDFLGLSTEEFDMGWVARLSSPETGMSVQLVTSDRTSPVDSVMSVHTSDVEAAYDEAQRLGFEIVHPLTVEPWGVHRFLVRAPDGNVVNVVHHPEGSVLKRWLAAGDRGEVDAFDELLHPDVVVHAPRGLSSSDRESEKQVWREAVAAVPDLRHDVQEVRSDGRVEMARVVVTGTMTGDFAGIASTGRAFRMDQAVICHLRDGRVTEAWDIADLAAVADRQVPG